MVGRELDDFFHRTAHAPGEVALSVEGLGRRGAFQDVSFEVRQGEVLGFAGLVGSGRTEVAESLFGVWPADTGTIRRGDVGGRDRQPAGGDGSRHRLRVRGSTPARVVAATVRHHQHHARRPAKVRVSLATRRPRRGTAHRRQLPPTPGHPHDVVVGARRQPLGWQPTEGDARQVARRQAVRARARRADARHRRRRQGRRPRAHRRAVGGGRRGDPDLVRPPRGTRHERPRAR